MFAKGFWEVEICRFCAELLGEEIIQLKIARDESAEEEELLLL